MARSYLAASFCLLFATCFSLSREEAEQRALRNNLEILAAKSDVQASKAARQEVLAAWLPQAFFTWNIKKYEHSSAMPGDEKGTYSGSLDISQTLFDASILRSYQTAALDLKLSDLEVAQVSLDTLFVTRQMYYSVILERELEAMQERHLNLLEETLQETRRRFDLGSATLFDVRQSAVFVSNAEPAVRAAKRSKLVALDRLNELFGKSPLDRDFFIESRSIPIEEINWLKDHLNLGAIPEEAFAPWEEIAEKIAPPVLIAQMMSEKSHAKVRESQARYLPRLDGFFNTSSAESAKWREQKWEWSTGIALRIPLFEGLGRKRAVNRAQSKLRASRFHKKQALNQQLVEVRHQLYRANEQIANVLSTESGFKLAKLARAQASDKYRLGMITLLDYKSAIDNLFDAEVRYHKARFRLIESYFALVRASGVDLIKCIGERVNGK